MSGEILSGGFRLGDSVRGIMSWIWMGMGWVGSWVHKFTWQWVGLDLHVCGLGWVVGYENGPMDNSAIEGK